MMKLKLTIITILFTIITTINAENRTVGDFVVDDYDGGISVTGYNGTATNLVIPSIIEGLEVKAIGDVAFSYNHLDSLFIPSSVENIGWHAFYNNSLEYVSFEDNSMISHIGSEAFSENASLLSVALPTSGIDGFINYSYAINDYSGDYYLNPGDNLPYFSFSYSVNDGSKFRPHTLSEDDDVTVENGIITSCGISDVVLVIPDSLHGQEINVIGENAFANNLFGLYLPKTIDSIAPNAFNASPYLPYTIDTVFFEDNSQLRYLSDNSFGTSVTIKLPTSSIEGVRQYEYHYSDSYETTICQAGSYCILCYDYYSECTLTAVVYAPPRVIKTEEVIIENGVITHANIPLYQDLIIPSELGGQTVIGIGESAFSNKNLCGISLPSTLKTIGYNAFSENLLDSLFIPKSVISIESYAFSNNSLNEIIIEENSNLKSVDANAFCNNPNLRSIKLPSSAIEGFLGYYDGYGNRYNPDEYISEFSSYLLTFGVYMTYTFQDSDFVVSDGVINDFKGEVALLQIPNVIDNQIITGISEYAFNHKGLLEVTLPSSLESIGRSAFAENHLTKIIIPEGVSFIGKYAFSENSLDSIKLANSVTYIGYGAFDGERIVLPAPQKEGYKLVGWKRGDEDYYDTYSEGDTVSNGDSYEPIFETESYPLNFNANGGQGKMDSLSIRYLSAGVIPPVEFENPPYIFVGWSTTDNSNATYSEASIYYMLSEGAELYAKWDLPSYLVSYENEGDLYYIYKTNNYPSTSPLPTTPIKENYMFAGWYTQENGQGVPFTTETVITEDITVYANWTEGASATKSISAHNFSIYPNPSSEYILIQNLANESNVNIYTSNGVLFFSQANVMSNTYIDISSFPVGVYTVKVGRDSEKLIIE